VFYFVIKAKGNQLQIFRLQDWYESLISSSDAEKGLFIAEADEVSFKPILVNETYNELQLMHPTSYKVFTVKKPSDTILFSEETEILQINDQFFLRPDIK